METTLIMKVYEPTGRERVEAVSYTPGEMEELFSTHERMWFNEGKTVERDTGDGWRTNYVTVTGAAKRLGL